MVDKDLKMVAFMIFVVSEQRVCHHLAATADKDLLQLQTVALMILTKNSCRWCFHAAMSKGGLPTPSSNNDNKNKN